MDEHAENRWLIGTSKKSCTSESVVYLCMARFYTSDVVWNFFHQQ